MKKFISILLILMLGLITVACSNSESETTEETSTSSETVVATDIPNNLMAYYRADINSFLENFPDFELVTNDEATGLAIYQDPNEDFIMSENNTIQLITLLPGSSYNLDGISFNDTLSEAQSKLEALGFTVSITPNLTTTTVEGDNTYTNMVGTSSDYPDTVFGISSDFAPNEENIQLLMLSDTTLAGLLGGAFDGTE